MQKIMTIPEVCATVSLSRATIYRLVKAGQFPKPCKLSPHRRGWPESIITGWMESKVS